MLLARSYLLRTRDGKEATYVKYTLQIWHRRKQ